MADERRPTDETTAEEYCLEAASSLVTHDEIWRKQGFPRGFWPDIARVAVEMALQKTFDPVLDFRPTRSGDVVKFSKKYERDMMSKHLERVATDQKASEPNPEDENPFNRFR